MRAVRPAFPDWYEASAFDALRFPGRGVTAAHPAMVGCASCPRWLGTRTQCENMRERGLTRGRVGVRNIVQIVRIALRDQRSDAMQSPMMIEMTTALIAPGNGVLARDPSARAQDFLAPTV